MLGLEARWAGSEIRFQQPFEGDGVQIAENVAADELGRDGGSLQPVFEGKVRTA